jgi:RNA polymerase sigma factor for flagellar operon FliA
MNREALILALLPQVHLIARCIHRGLPSHVPLDDLISAGMLGAIAAVDRFDPAAGVELKIYAAYKIRFAIRESFREMDWVGRYQRNRWKEIEAAIEGLTQEQQGNPGDEDVAARLGISIEKYRRRRREAVTMLLSDNNQDGLALSDYVPDPDPLPDARAVASAEARRLAAAIAALPGRTKAVLRLYFYEDLTLLEIAARLGVTESRASQLKTQALARLRAHLGVQPVPQRAYPLRAARSEEHNRRISEAMAQRRRTHERKEIAALLRLAA